MKTKVALFPLGRTVATPGALEALARTGTSPSELLDRHVSGDWGDCSAEDKRANDFDLEHEGRLFSVYHLRDETKVWCITEHDKSSTCLLLPSDY
jgi:hypothetical protein